MRIGKRSAVVAMIAALGVALCACSPTDITRSRPIDSGASVPQDPGGSVSPMRMVAVEQGVRSGISTARDVVIRDRGAWEELWAEHVAGQQQAASLPNVDFTSQMVLAVFLGEKPSSGYAVSVIGATEADGKVVVDVEVAVPPRDMSQLAVLTRPFHIVTVPRTEGGVDFVATETASMKGR
jgi:hypothetical protein